MKCKFLIGSLILLLAPSAIADFSNKYLNQWKRDFPSAKWTDIAPAQLPKTLVNNRIPELNNNQFEALVNFQMGRLKASALVIAKGNEVVYEKYPADEPASESVRLGFSMSKSVTAISVGVAHCRGYIDNLDNIGGKYIEDLKSTSWGQSTIRQLLTMSSGSSNVTDIYTGNVSDSVRKKLGKIYWGEYSGDFIAVMKKNDEKAFPPGAKFTYNNFDTFMLSHIVEGATRKSFARFFEDEVVPLIGLEGESKWLTNTYGQTSSYNGFSAKPLDWIRIGRFTLEVLNNGSEDVFYKCLSNFIGQMTSLQIDADDKLDRGYGFQTWIGCGNSADFCFQGWGGQYLLFDVKKDLIMYMSSRSEKPTGWATRQFFDSIISRIEE